MKDIKDIIRSVLALFLICLVVSAALALVNSFTSPVSENNALMREYTARKELIPEADDFLPVEQDFSDEIVSAFAAKDAGENTLGYVFTVQEKGFGGTIKVMCAISSDGTILRVNTLDVSSETKTLGGKTAEPAYTDQYVGKTETLDGVNAISGATVTSTAYRACVTAAFEAFSQIGGGSK